jgi:hypothetical protein
MTPSVRERMVWLLASAEVQPIAATGRSHRMGPMAIPVLAATTVGVS